jgi:hypothetical protein
MRHGNRSFRSPELALDVALDPLAGLLDQGQHRLFGLLPLLALLLDGPLELLPEVLDAQPEFILYELAIPALVLESLAYLLNASSRGLGQTILVLLSGEVFQIDLFL